MGDVAPLVEDARVGQAQRHRDRHHAHGRPADGVAGPVAARRCRSPSTRITSHDAPSSIGGHRAQTHEQREPAIAGVGLVAGGDAAQQHALAEGRHQRPRPEGEDPARLVLVAGADAELERHAAQHAQHHEVRAIQLAQHRAPGEGKGRGEQAHAQQQPELVGVAPGAEQAHRGRALRPAPVAAGCPRPGRSRPAPSTTPSTMKVSGPYSLPSTAPQAKGKAEANRPMPSSSQNSLASRQGLSRLIMRRVFGRRQLQQDAHAQVEAVQHHAGGDHHEQQRHEGQRHPE